MLWMCCVFAPQVATSKIDEYARGMISGSGSTLFEELGLYYIGPVDGHNVDDLVAGQWGGTKGHWCHGGGVFGQAPGGVLGQQGSGRAPWGTGVSGQAGVQELSNKQQRAPAGRGRCGVAGIGRKVALVWEAAGTVLG
jgi:hypothetical protein